jgi:multimeric flavodoxin WrbA
MATEKRVLIIDGSARDDGNTTIAIRELSPFKNYERLELRQLKIEHYSYENFDEAADDFIFIAKKMTRADVIIFATPVYWYAMSGRMKVLLDRLSELISRPRGCQHLGRALKGKEVFVIACGSDPMLPAGFDVPFKLTAGYFEMAYHEIYYRQFT